MKSGKRIWEFLLVVGTAPFLIAVGFCFVSSLLPPKGMLLRLTFWDYLLFYSLMYWPSYLAGMLLILLCLVMIRRKR